MLRLPFAWILLLALAWAESAAFTPSHLASLKNRTKLLFDHGWSAYMDHGFPNDEVRPLSCQQHGPSFSYEEQIFGDILANVSSTVLDNLDTLIVMEDWAQLEISLQHLHHNRHNYFHKDATVQVFEASIRWLGGLLSTHLALVDVAWKQPEMQQIASAYDGFLLEMAYDLGLRLIPSYNTATGLPLPRINLLYGLAPIPHHRNSEACTAGVTTPFLEFTLLSRLTGDKRFETLTRTSFDMLWDARSELGLMPMSLNPLHNTWTDSVTGIGASIDSFYEYALKGSILFRDDSLWTVFSRSYEALMSHSAITRGLHGWTIFSNIQTSGICRYVPWIDSLSAFWPGLQVLAGRLTDAVSTHLVYLKIWDHFDSIPERWMTEATVPDEIPIEHKLDFAIDLEWYPLRPEFIESTYYLYRATRDPMYLQIGLRVLKLFETQFKAPCGFSGFQDITDGQKQDRMETFVLGESLKYLYLLFDEGDESYVHSKDMQSKNWIFSTEAHPLWLSEKLENESATWFASKRSKIPIPEFPPLQVGMLENIMRGIARYTSQPPIGTTTAALEGQIPIENRLGSGFKFLHAELAQCEVQPRQFVTKDPHFVTSGYLHWQHVFLPNFSLKSTLVRPPHLAEYDNGSTIELTKEFLNTYGLSSDLQCARVPTVQEKELVVGKLVRPENYETYRVEESTSQYPFARGDVVMPLFQGRLRFEHMVADSVDGNNVHITIPYLRKAQNGTGKKFQYEVARFSAINGHVLEPGQVIWTERECFGKANGMFEVTDNDYVYMEGLYVENLKVY